MGLLAGYSHTNFKVGERDSSGSSDNYHVGLYGGTRWGDLAFRTGAAYTWHDLSTSRSVIFPGFADSLTRNTNDGTAQIFGDGKGIRIDTAGSVRFEPFANLAYVNVRHRRVHRDGWGGGSLSGASSNTDATFATLGIRASGDGFALTPAIDATARGMIGWRHAFGDVTPLSRTVAFAGSDTLHRRWRTDRQGCGGPRGRPRFRHRAQGETRTFPIPASSARAFPTSPSKPISISSSEAGRTAYSVFE